MSTINPMMTSAAQSPRTQMNDRISAAVSAGTISSTDQKALGSALDSIDSTLPGTKPSGDMKARMDDLIQQQVDSGALTDDQASELQSFFAQGPEGGEDTGGPGGPGGPRGASGPLPAKPEDSSEEASDDDSSNSTTSPVSDAASTKLDALEAFLEKLRASQASSSGYGASANKTSAATGLVLDSLA